MRLPALACMDFLAAFGAGPDAAAQKAETADPRVPRRRRRLRAARALPRLHRLTRRGRTRRSDDRIPGVLHQFDGRDDGNWSDPTAPTTRNCRRVERGGVIVNAATRQPFSFGDACVEYGPGGGYDAEATAQAKAEVTALLKEVFALP